MELSTGDLSKIKKFFDDDFSRYLKIRISFKERHYRKTICSLIYANMNLDKSLKGAEKVVARNKLSSEFLKKDNDYIDDFIFSVKEILKIKS